MSNLGFTTGLQLVRVASRSPISIAEANCPRNLVGFQLGSEPRDLVVRFSLKPGGTAMGAIADLTLEVFEGSSRIYSASPDGSVLKVELAEGSFGLNQETSFQDRLRDQPWDDPLEGLASFINFTDPTKELWRQLMTPNQLLPLPPVG